jgi:hypothetical protein
MLGIGPTNQQGATYSIRLLAGTFRPQPYGGEWRALGSGGDRFNLRKVNDSRAKTACVAVTICIVAQKAARNF